MNSLDKQYTDLLQDILDNGVTKQDRTGTGTISVFGRQIRHKMADGFPLITTKKIPFRLIATELMWFLRGDTNIKFLVDNDCHIWDGDAYKNYLNVVMFEKPDYFHEKHGHLKMSVKKEGDNYLPLTQEEFINRIKTDNKFTHWGDLGKIYGKQWRDWGGKQVSVKDGKVVTIVNDQIQNLINDLKTNPDSRRLMVNAWNVGELDQMVLPPCHYGFQVYTRELKPRQRTEVAQRMGITLSEGSKSSKEWDKDCDEKNIPKRAISLMWNQRSVDTFLGLPFNIASYGLLLEIIAKAVNMVPDELIGNLGDTHLYANHVEQAKEQIGRELSLKERYKLWPNKDNEFAKKTYNSTTDKEFKHGFLSSRHQGSVPRRTREPFPLPTLKHMKTDEFYKALSEDTSLFAHLDPTDFQVENYQAHPHIKAPLSN